MIAAGVLLVFAGVRVYDSNDHPPQVDRMFIFYNLLQTNLAIGRGGGVLLGIGGCVLGAAGVYFLFEGF
jgi:hypothetical protein